MHYAQITERLRHLGSGKWAVHFEARRRAAAGMSICELTIGEPDLPTHPDLIDECTRSMRAGRTRYSNGRGEANLVTALVQKYGARRSGLTEKNVLCFPGTQTALFAVMMALVEAGDGVLVGNPLYATYEGVVSATGAHMIDVPLRAAYAFHMQPVDLESAITPAAKVLLLNTPHNPTGAVLEREEIVALGEICARHDLWIVCDEVYEDIIFEKSLESPFDLPHLAERTIVVSSISKSHAATGFRSGWAIGPEPLCERLLPISETMLFGNQPFIADMTALALTQPFETASTMRRDFHRRAAMVCSIVANSPYLAANMPEAGMFILIDVSGTGASSEEFAWDLLNTENIAVMPGSAFGDQAKPFVRVSLTVPDEQLAAAVSRIVKVAHRRATA